MKNPIVAVLKSLATVQGEAEKLRGQRIAAEGEIATLDAKRGEMLLDAEPTDIVKHDQARAKLSVTIEQIDARLVRIEQEAEAAASWEDEERRRAKYAAAKKVRSETLALYDRYEVVAVEMASILRKANANEALIREANLDLPEGYVPLEKAETDNSVPSTSDEYREPFQLTDGTTVSNVILNPGRPGRPHVSFRETTKIGSAKGRTLLYPG